MFVPSELNKVIQTITVKKGRLAVFWLGQASFVFKGADDVTVAVDPYFSDIVERLAGWQRLWEPPFPAEQLVADVIVYTHDHIDHLDPDAAVKIATANPKSLFVGPQSCIAHLRKLGIAPERMVILNRGQQRTIRGIDFRAQPANHMPPGDPEPFAIGVYMKIDGVSVYHTGDTVYSDEVLQAAQSLGHLDVLIVPINGNYAVMNTLDAALLTRALAPRHVIPCHFGMFANNTDDPYRFVAHVRALKLPTRPIVLSVGGGCVLQ